MSPISYRLSFQRFTSLNAILATLLLVFKHGFVLSHSLHHIFDYYLTFVLLFIVGDRLILPKIKGLSYFKRFYQRDICLTFFVLAYIIFTLKDLPYYADKVIYLYITAEALTRLSLGQIWLKSTFLHQRIILLSFSFLIAIGSLILSLPRFHTQPISFVDTLFIATSAVCVTGLSPIDIQQSFSHLGHWAIMGLFQLGGLGPITLLAFVRYLTSRDNSLKKNFAIQEMLSVKTLGNLKSLIIVLFSVTLLTELIGAMFIYLNTPADKDFFWALFHAISAFCNAGFSLNPDSFISYSSNIPVIMALGGLILVGGLGFHLHLDIIIYLKNKFNFKYRNKRRQLSNPRLEVQTYLVVISTFFLVVGGMAFFLIFESKTFVQEVSTGQGLANAFFQSMTLRTAGFNSIDFTALSNATLLLSIVWMVIGAGAVSTGGGLKVITVSLLFATIRSYLNGSREVRIHFRTVPLNVIELVSSVVSLYFCTVAVTWFLLSLTEPNLDIFKLLFESISAISTVGLTLDTTSQLSSLGKIILCFAMLAGRIGPLTLLASFVSRRRSGDNYRYPTGKFSIT